ncbi:MAG TPA: hypothetical protein VKY31_08565 [Terriglobia bacterium]|nr:hypothetical protein [Terriglobia bacterium]
MKLPSRISILFFFGLFAVGSTALGYYYYFVYEPPLKAAAQFMDAMEKHDGAALQADIVVSSDIDEGKLRLPEPREIQSLLAEDFQRGRILDQRRHDGKTRDLYYLVYREPDGRVYALIATEFDGRFRIVIPEIPLSRRHRYLWDYTWTN